MRRPAVLALLSFVAACGGGGGGGDGPVDPALSYPALLARVDEAASVTPTNTGEPVTAWSATDLPAGLSIHPTTGVISGTPTTASPTAVHVVTATRASGDVALDVSIQVTPALPPEMVFLADGFAAEVLLDDLAVPVKMALAPDGRLFFGELSTGNVRVVDAGGTLLATAFATVPVLTGNERGLLGLALAPDFATSGTVVLFHSAPAITGHANRNRVVQLTATGDVGGSLVVLVDDLPLGQIHNAGDVKFGPDGQLYVSLGETGNEDLAQADGTPAGRILRYTPTGGIPADNPIAGSPEWVRGLRNSFDMTFHAPTGGLFASENGPNAGDELNYIQKGRNYGWPSLFGGNAGFRVQDWTPVIVPTGLVFHDGTGFGSEFEDDLFLCAYDATEVRRLVLSGPALTDLDAETQFAQWTDPGGVDNKPLDILQRPDGSLLVSTFTAIWRIYRYP